MGIVCTRVYICDFVSQRWVYEHASPYIIGRLLLFRGALCRASVYMYLPMVNNVIIWWAEFALCELFDTIILIAIKII